MSASTAVITPSDFLHRTTDRKEFDLGMIRHIVAALDGAPVAITVDKRTGHTMLDVKLVGFFHGGPGRGLRVTVEDTYSDGTTARTNFRVVEVGMILPLGGRSDGVLTDPKWIATRTYMDEQSAAIAVAQRQYEAAGLVAETGRWEARSDESGVVVSYNPGTPREGQARESFWYTRVEATEAAVELAAREARSVAYRAQWAAEAVAE